MNTLFKEELNHLANKLETKRLHIKDTDVVIGFDAFVDESMHIVEQRTSPQSYDPMATISDFGQWALTAAGKSGSREFVNQATHQGGCAVNMGDGIATLGFPLTAFTGIGTPAHPVFDDFITKCKAIIPLGMEPGRALVSEFNDGKLMLCSFSHFATFTPDYLQTQFADGQFLNACQQAKGIAFTSWSVYPYMTKCWQYMCKEVLADLTHRPHFFFDLADPASRSKEDLLDMLQALQGFEKIGRVTLSLNGNEANQIAKALTIEPSNESHAGWETLASHIREYAQISETSIHLVKSASTATATETTSIDGPYCAAPQKSVGAGDRFNAGFLAGLLMDLSPRERLAVGCASSGYFVRNATSGTIDDLITFIRHWRNESY